MFAQLLYKALRCVTSEEDLVEAAKEIEALDFEDPAVVAASSSTQFVIEGILDKITPRWERKKRGADEQDEN